MEDNAENTTEEKISVEIVLIGAPGSGRSELAKRLQQKFPEYEIIDDYISEIENLNIAIGQFGGYHENLWVHYIRFAKEQAIRNQRKNFITVGSDIESLAHQALLTQFIGDQVITEDNIAETQTHVTIGQVQALYLQLYFAKDFAWYVPLEAWDAEKTKPGERIFAEKLDEAIRAVLQGYRISVPTLVGTVDDKVEKMAKVITQDTEKE